MSKIAIVGAGRVGTAAAKILLNTTDNEVVLIDTSEEALTAAYTACADIGRPEYLEALNPTMPLETFTAYNREQLEATLKSCGVDLVMNTAPFDITPMIAEVALKCGCHYVDFTEDAVASAAVRDLSVSRVTFVPQTGLAPGLVSYVGLSLFKELQEPSRLDLRVGALPQISFGPGNYAITWSPEGLVNEYLKPSYQKVQGMIEEVPSLDDHETLVVNGVQYEGFTTSGGCGNLDSYEGIPSVQYKSLRFPGHLEYIQKLLGKVDGEFEDAVLLFKNTFQRTRDDLVVLVAHASDIHGNSASAGLHFYPADELGITALELTTAGTGCAIVELILGEHVDAGILNAGQIPFEALMSTSAMRLVFDHVG